MNHINIDIGNIEVRNAPVVLNSLLSCGVNRISTLLNSGDSVCIKRATISFAGYVPQEVYEVVYYEFDQGDWLATSPEYFKLNQIDLAITSFIHRSQSDNPHEISGCYSFSKIFELEK